MIVFEHWFTYTTPPNFTRFKGIIKAFSGICVRLTSITFPVIWSSVLISVTWVALLWAGHVCLSGSENITSHDEMAPPSFTSSRFTLSHYGRLATQLSRFTLWHNGCRAEQHGLNRRPQQTFERWTPRTQESPRELARQSEAKRKQAPQREANVCRHKCNLKNPPLLITQDTQ